MNLQTFTFLYGLSVPIFFLIDMVWLSVVARDLYQNQLGHLLGDVNWTAAIVFYLLFLIGLTFFAIYPAVDAASWKQGLLYGSLFGFFTYATYDLTNLATLKDWPLSIVFIDIAWGTFLGGTVSALTVLAYLTFFS